MTISFLYTNPFVKKHGDKLRFGLVGIVNTSLDIGLLFLLVTWGMPVLISNIISTGTALLFSYVVNKHFTFRSSHVTTSRHVVLFLSITLVGLWIIQPIVIEGVHLLLIPSHLGSYLVLLVGKLCATAFTLVWNFVLYRRFVFKTESLS